MEQISTRATNPHNSLTFCLCLKMTEDPGLHVDWRDPNISKGNLTLASRLLVARTPKNFIIYMGSCNVTRPKGGSQDMLMKFLDWTKSFVPVRAGCLVQRELPGVRLQPVPQDSGRGSRTWQLIKQYAAGGKGP